MELFYLNKDIKVQKNGIFLNRQKHTSPNVITVRFMLGSKKQHGIGPMLYSHCPLHSRVGGGLIQLSLMGPRPLVLL